MDKFIGQLKNFQKKIYSQNGEDGILLEIFNRIGTTDKYFVEFGAWDGVHLSNTANLRINHGWSGLLMEGDKSKCNDLIKNEFVTSDNINELFEKYNVNKTFDLLSIDIDSHDYWCWKKCNYNPRVVIIEFNSSLDPLVPIATIDKTSTNININNSYFGASISAFYNLGRSKGYSLVFRSNQQNLIFIKNDLLHPEDQNIPVTNFINQDNNIYNYPPPANKEHWNEYADSLLWKFYGIDHSREWTKL